jgi:hypothetical protein
MAQLSWSDPYGGHSIADIAAQFQVRPADVGDIVRSITQERMAQQKQLADIPTQLTEQMNQREKFRMEEELNKARIAHLGAITAAAGQEGQYGGLTYPQYLAEEHRKRTEEAAAERDRRLQATATANLSSQERMRQEAGYKELVEQYERSAAKEARGIYGVDPEKLFDPTQQKAGIWDSKKKTFTPAWPGTKPPPGANPTDKTGATHIQIGGEGGATLPITTVEMLQRRLAQEKTPEGGYLAPPTPLPPYVAPRAAPSAEGDRSNAGLRAEAMDAIQRAQGDPAKVQAIRDRFRQLSGEEL